MEQKNEKCFLVTFGGSDLSYQKMTTLFIVNSKPISPSNTEPKETVIPNSFFVIDKNGYWNANLLCIWYKLIVQNSGELPKHSKWEIYVKKVKNMDSVSVNEEFGESLKM